MLDGLGYRDWTNGEVPDHTTLDQYLQSQTIMRFATTAARDAAITAPKLGAHSFIDSLSTVMVYDGTTWQGALGARCWFNGIGSDDYISWEADAGSGIDEDGIRFVINGVEALKVIYDGDWTSGILFRENNDGILYNADTEVLSIWSAAERLRLDAGEGLGLSDSKLSFRDVDVATSDDYIEHTGTRFEFVSDGGVSATIDDAGQTRLVSAGDEILRIVRTGFTNEGGLIAFHDTAETDRLGHIGYDGDEHMYVYNEEPNGNLYFGARNAVRLFLGNAALAPFTDDALGLGTSSLRFTELWATDGTINTSDERLKTELGDALGLSFLRRLRTFAGQWSADPGLIHQFFSAQNLQAAMEAEGYNPDDHALVRTGEDGILHTALTELLPAIVNSIVEIDARIT